MSNYRRFVSYIYAYRNGKKEQNTGFAKVESRNGTLKIGIQVTGIREQETLDAYLFVRKGEKLLGIFLGAVTVAGSVGELSVSTDSRDIEGSGYSLEEIAGLWIQGEGGNHYITLWDEEPLRKLELEILRKEGDGERTEDSETSEEQRRDGDHSEERWEGTEDSEASEEQWRDGNHSEERWEGTEDSEASEEQWRDGNHPEEQRERTEDSEASGGQRRGRNHPEERWGEKEERKEMGKQWGRIEESKLPEERWEQAEDDTTAEKLWDDAADEKRSGKLWQADMAGSDGKTGRGEREKETEGKIESGIENETERGTGNGEATIGQRGASQGGAIAEKQGISQEAATVGNEASLEGGTVGKKGTVQGTAITEKRGSVQGSETAEKEEAVIGDHPEGTAEASVMSDDMRETAVPAEGQTENADGEKCFGKLWKNADEREERQPSQREADTPQQKAGNPAELSGKTLESGIQDTSGQCLQNKIPDTSGQFLKTGNTNAAEGTTAFERAPHFGGPQTTINGVRAQENHFSGEEPSRMTRHWMMLSRTYAHVQPFRNSEVVDCLRISPRELGMFCQKDPAIGRNTFLLHGYYHFRHLLLIRCEDNSYRLAVPGYYSPQEQRTAVFYGFPYFMENREQRGRGKQGYWCRPIE